VLCPRQRRRPTCARRRSRSHRTPPWCRVQTPRVRSRQSRNGGAAKGVERACNCVRERMRRVRSSWVEKGARFYRKHGVSFHVSATFWAHS
jgi:hypothetical protein